MESVLQSTAALAATSLFIHADVTGAYMNDQLVSHGGVPPRMFPPNRPIYSGHFHKPHLVQQENVHIEYLGSPYQVSLSEARQDKAVVVLDSSDGWKCVERIPLDIGRKHFRVDNLNDFLKLDPFPVDSTAWNMVDSSSPGAFFVRPDDRVVFTIEKERLNELRRSENSSLVSHTELLRESGVVVELREEKGIIAEARPGIDLGLLEDMSLESTWNAFIDDQMQREAMSNATANELRVAGLEILNDLDSEDVGGFKSDRSQGPSQLQLHSVSVEGFGPFHEKVDYPLLNRGLVLLRGSNRDGGSDRYVSSRCSTWLLTNAYTVF
jgi:hypothetical protein